MEPNFGALEVRIEKVKEEVIELKESVKVIADNTVVMRENLTRLTTVQENFEKNLNNVPIDPEEKAWRRKMIERVVMFAGFVLLSYMGLSSAGIELLK